jgi:hypothetical protein
VHHLSTYREWLLCSRNAFIASLIPVYLQLIERGHLQGTPLEQLCTEPSDAATVRNIFGTPVVEQLSVQSSHLFGCLQYPEIFIPLRQTSFLEQPEVMWSQTKGKGWVLHFSNRFSGQKLLKRPPCELEHWHGGKSNCWAKVQAFFCAQLHITASLLPHNKLG